MKSRALKVVSDVLFCLWSYMLVNSVQEISSCGISYTVYKNELEVKGYENL